MNSKQQIRQRKQKMRNNLKVSLAKSGQIINYEANHTQATSLPEISKLQKQGSEQSSHMSGKIRRKTSLDIRGMGDKFDMFECNEIFIYDDFDSIYDLVRKIDEGAQSVVYQAIQKKTQKKFAVKTTRKKDSDVIRGLKTQFRILKNLDHPYIIKAYNLFIDQKMGVSQLVLQYFEAPNLRFHMLKNRIIKQTQVAQILTSILNALAYLHSHGICHRDIKPQNVLFNASTRQIKLVDFDISKMIKYSIHKLEMLTNTGTLYYKAPEIFNSNYYNQQIDIWAVGVISYQMIMGDFPFKSKYEGEVIRQIKQCQPKYDGSATDLCANFIKKCLQKDPLKRFTATQALKSPFILKYSSISSTNSSPMRRKNSQDHIRNAFGLQVSKCYDQDSGLKNTESLQLDSGIRVRVSDKNSDKQFQNQQKQ